MTDAYHIAATKPGGTDILERQTFEPGTPEPGDVLVRQTAIGVNFIDVYIRTGAYPWPVDENLVLGCEAAGVIEAIGDGVENFSVGDRVAYVTMNGAYASHRIMGTANLVKLPDEIDDNTAAAVMLKGLTAHYLLHSSFAVEPNQTVLFHAAAGGVGLIAGQWLASKGVNAIGTAGGPEKCALAKDHGFNHVIDYKSEDFVERVTEITEGAGVDAVYNSVGKDTLRGSIQCLRKFGYLISFGQSSGPLPDFKVADLAVGSLYLQRPTLFHYMANRTWLEKAAEDLFGLIASGDIRININQEFPLEKAGDAHDALEGRKTTGCTILLP